jgi:hypothetical protein
MDGIDATTSDDKPTFHIFATLAAFERTKARLSAA